jgi:ElaB/YqjD/DUF883 family membrane-anchored ribosome-binding protein
MSGSTPAKNLPDQFANAVGVVKEKVTDFGRTATEKMEETRTAAAGGLDRTASTLHESGDKVAGLAHSTADKLSSTAEYLRSNSVRTLMGDLEQVIKENPGPSLLIAGLLGFSLGRALRSSD